MAYKRDYCSGFRYYLTRESGFYKKIGITMDYRIATFCESENIGNFISFYEKIFNVYNNKFSGSSGLLTRKDIEKLKCVYTIQTSNSINNECQYNIPDILKIYGSQWHWWSENFGLSECGLVSDIIAVDTSGKCLFIFKEDCLDILLMYHNMFHDDFKSNGSCLPHLKTMLDDFAFIISTRGFLSNRKMFCS